MTNLYSSMVEIALLATITIVVFLTHSVTGELASRKAEITIPSAIRRINTVVQITTRIRAEEERIADIKLINEPNPIKSPYVLILENDKKHSQAGHWISGYAGFQFSFEIMLIICIPILYGQLLRRVLRRFIYPRLNFPEESIEEHPLIPLTYLQQTRDELRVTREKRNGIDWLGTKFLIRASDSFVDLKELMNTQAKSEIPKSPWQLLRVLAAFNGIYTRNKANGQGKLFEHVMPSTTSRIAAKIEPTESILEFLDEEQLEIAFQQGLLRQIPKKAKIPAKPVPRTVVPKKSVAVGTSAFYFPESGDRDQKKAKGKRKVSNLEKPDSPMTIPPPFSSGDEESSSSLVPEKKPSPKKMEGPAMTTFKLNGKTYVYKRRVKTMPAASAKTLPNMESNASVHPDEETSEQVSPTSQQKLDMKQHAEKQKIKERTLAKRANRVEVQKAKLMGEARVQERLHSADQKRLELELLRIQEEERQKNDAIYEEYLRKEAEMYNAKVARQKKQEAYARYRNQQVAKTQPAKQFGTYWNRLKTAGAARVAKIFPKAQPVPPPSTTERSEQPSRINLLNQEEQARLQQQPGHQHHRHHHHQRPPLQVERPHRRVAPMVKKHYMQLPQRVLEEQTRRQEALHAERELEKKRKQDEQEERARQRAKPKVEMGGYYGQTYRNLTGPDNTRHYNATDS